MLLDDLIEKFRAESGDSVEPYQWDDDYITGLFNDAVNEACVRKDLIFDASTADVCKISAVSGTAYYSINDAISRITRAYLVDSGGSFTYLDLVDREYLDQMDPYWREGDGDIKYLIVDEVSVQLNVSPTEDYNLNLEVYRMPLISEVMPTKNSPAISSAHHAYLHHWPMSVVFLQDDADYFSPDVAAMNLKKFEDYFGTRPDADRKRASQANRPHRNKLW